jgi:hypothetical protein
VTTLNSSFDRWRMISLFSASENDMRKLNKK